MFSFAVFVLLAFACAVGIGGAVVLLKRDAMSPALARLSLAVDRLIHAFNNAPSEAEIAALADKIETIVPPPPENEEDPR